MNNMKLIALFLSIATLGLDSAAAGRHGGGAGRGGHGGSHGAKGHGSAHAGMGHGGHSAMHHSGGQHHGMGNRGVRSAAGRSIGSRSFANRGSGVRYGRSAYGSRYSGGAGRWNNQGGRWAGRGGRWNNGRVYGGYGGGYWRNGVWIAPVALGAAALGTTGYAAADSYDNDYVSNGDTQYSEYPFSETDSEAPVVNLEENESDYNDESGDYADNSVLNDNLVEGYNEPVLYEGEQRVNYEPSEGRGHRSFRHRSSEQVRTVAS